MSIFNLSLHLLPLFLLFFGRCSAAVGTAAHYEAPYAPTQCFGSDVEPFPANDLFAAVDASVWSGGSVCGKLFNVKCLSNGCTSDQIIQVKVVDNAGALVSDPSSSDKTFVLSRTSFALIANPLTSDEINIEYAMVGGGYTDIRHRG